MSFKYYYTYMQQTFKERKHLPSQNKYQQSIFSENYLKINNYWTLLHPVIPSRISGLIRDLCPPLTDNPLFQVLEVGLQCVPGLSVVHLHKEILVSWQLYGIRGTHPGLRLVGVRFRIFYMTITSWELDEGPLTAL